MRRARSRRSDAPGRWRAGVLTGALLLAAAPLSRPAAAQQGPEVNLVLSFFGGAVNGHELWSVPRQPVVVIGSIPATHDTMSLSRATTSGFTAGFSATYYRGGHFGWHVEIVYAEHSFDDGCLMLSAAPDPRNDELCQSIRAESHGGGVVSITAGVSLRATTRGWIIPYARGTVGIASYSSSTVEVAGFFTSGGNPSERVIILDNDASRVSPTATVAAGLAAVLGSSTQLRLELRDLVAGETVLTGPADALGRAPTDTRVSHHLSLSIGLDVILERKRGRRY
ncbi:MAG: hypothetical protein ACREMV_01060 [Gemmatimonadales bacterium]